MRQLTCLVVLGKYITKFVVLLVKTLGSHTKLNVVQKNNCQEVSAEKSDIRWRYEKLLEMRQLTRLVVLVLSDCLPAFINILKLAIRMKFRNSATQPITQDLN